VAGSVGLSVATTANTAAVAVAEPADDANLRLILRESVVPGAVRVALTREPNYFAADGLAGADDVTLVSRRDGRIVGTGRLSVYDLVRNGRAQRIGYLGALRITSGTRESARMLRDGYKLLLRESGGIADGYFTSIASDNKRARRVLENGARFGLPTYRPLCDLVTLIAPVAGSRVRSAKDLQRGEAHQRAVAHDPQHPVLSGEVADELGLAHAVEVSLQECQHLRPFALGQFGASRRDGHVTGDLHRYGPDEDVAHRRPTSGRKGRWSHASGQRGPSRHSTSYSVV